MIFFLLLRMYSKIYVKRLHYLSPFSTLCVSRVSNFQIPNMIQRLYIQAPNRYTFIYTAYVELGTDLPVGTFLVGAKQGSLEEKISPENCQGGDNSSSR